MEILKVWEKYSLVMQNTLKSNEWRRLWVHKSFKIEIQQGGANNSDLLQNEFPQKLSPPHFDLQKFQDPEKSTPESCIMHWNLMNDEEFGYVKLLKFKYRIGDQIIQAFCRIGLPQKLGLLSLIWRNSKILRKPLVNYTECTEIYWVTKNLGP